MSISLAGGVVTEAAAPEMDQFIRTGVIRTDAFAVCDDVDKLKQIKFDPSAQATNTSCTIASQASSSGTFSLPNAAGGVLGLSGGADTIVNALAAFAANGFVAYVYRASSAKWYRIG